MDSSASIFRQTYFSCVNIILSEVKYRFFEEMRPKVGLYANKRAPLTIDATILLAQSFDTT